MKIALAQINPVVGDIAGNIALVERDLGRAAEAGADLVIFPELTVIGYPPKDLLLKPACIKQCLAAIERLASRCTNIAAIIGYPAPSLEPQGRALHNAVAFCAHGRIVHTHAKSLLPTYDVFDEHRYFEPATNVACSELDGTTLGITICEDLWNDEELFERQLYRNNPTDELCKQGAQVLINSSASPFVEGKQDFRLKLFANAARRCGVPLVFCNQVGGNDELVFDGNSCVIDANGEVIAHAKDFEEDLLIVDLESTGVQQHEGAKKVITTSRGVASVYHALVLGIRDYCRKCGFKDVVMGLSGGIDSAVTAALCVAAIGSDHVRGVAMPSRYSSGHSVDDARELADRLDMPFDVIHIGPAHDAMEQILAEVFVGREPGVAEENIQARIRGATLMAMSNKFGSLLVTTGNKSELAVGYCTLYGDMCGGLAALSDVPKMLVYELAEWINENAASPLLKTFGRPVIPENTITKPPSAELRPDQKDEDSLPPYPLLDEIIERYVELEESAATIIVDMKADPDTVQRVVRLIDRNEYKRKQAAPGLKVTGRAFGFGRRMPIAQRYENSVEDEQAENACE